MRILAIVAFCLSGAGCSAGVNYAIDNYRGVEVVGHIVLPPDGKRYADYGNGPVDLARSYRIFDKPAENRLMITASLGDAAAIGAVRGLTMIDANSPVHVYRDAALDWLKSQGRTCVATETFEVIRLQYEVKYACTTSAERSAAAVPPKR